MAYTTTMKAGYQFVGSRMPPWGTGNSIAWHTWINFYCNQYKYAGKPLDANAVAGLISRENGRWNPTVKGGDYATTGSIGLGQFTNQTGPKYGINNYNDKINPEKNIKAICNLFSRCLATANGNYRLAYNVYNAGHIVIGPSKATIANMDGFEVCYKWWAKFGQGKIPVAPIKTANNEVAVTQAKAKAIADTNAQRALQDKLTAQDRKEKLAEEAQIKKAQLSKNNQAVILAQAKAKANEIARKQASDLAKSNAIRKANENAEAIKQAHKTNNPIQNKPSSPRDAQEKKLPIKINDISKAKVLKSGISIIGLLAIVLLVGNAEIPQTELE